MLFTNRSKFISKKSSVSSYCCWFIVAFIFIYLIGAGIFFSNNSKRIFDVKISNEKIVLENEQISTRIIPKVMSSPDGNYPVYNNLLNIIENWNPDNPEIPVDFVETLQHFNYSDPVERAYAEKFRNAELPFKVYDVPELNSVIHKWNDDYLSSVMEKNLRVEKSKDNHFMYFKASPRKKFKDWAPPQEVLTLSFDNWLQRAKQADIEKLDHDAEHYYLTIGSTSRYDQTFFNSGFYFYYMYFLFTN
jgi:hypothetical protein